MESRCKEKKDFSRCARNDTLINLSSRNEVRDLEQTESLPSGVVASRVSESVVKNLNDPERRAIALASLFHLVGDIHQPLHTAQLFTVDYPQRDRGGNEIFVRVKEAEQPMDLHRFWDGVITSSSNLTRLRNEATALLALLLAGTGLAVAKECQPIGGHGETTLEQGGGQDLFVLTD
jgi:hypothetical protein